MNLTGRSVSDREPVHPFSRVIAVAESAEGEATYRLQAEPDELKALAERLGLVAIDRLEGEAKLWHVTDVSRVRVRVNFRADVIQSCVVTLEPIPARIEDTFERDYVTLREPQDEISDGTSGTMREVIVGLEDPDEPEPRSGEDIDLGVAVVEQLALALDPYPRKPGAVFAEYEDDRARGHPFAALAPLKGGDKE